MEPKKDRQIGKSILITLTMVLAVTVAVMGYHWSDTSDKPFWSGFWNVAAVVCLVACVAGWAILNSMNKNKR